MVELKDLTAFIPAAGYGTRMGKRGTEYQKCMLPIWEEQKPIMFYIINNLKNLGITNFVIAVNHHKEQIISYFKDGSSLGVNIKYIKGNFNSTYETLMKTINFLPEVFIYSHGDMIFNPCVYYLLIEKYNINSLNTIALMPNNNLYLTHPQIEISDQKVTSVYFDAKQGEYPYMYLGAAIYNKNDFIRYNCNDLSGMVEKMITWKLSMKEDVNAIIYNDEWRHLMNEDDYQGLIKEKKWLKCYRR